MKFPAFITVFALFFCCCSKQGDVYQPFLSNADAYFLLEVIEIPVVNDFNIHIVKKEFLNDSSIIIHIQQNRLGPKKNEFDDKFNFKGMEVFVYPKILNYWVPDSFNKRFLVRYRQGAILLDSLPDYSLKLWSEQVGQSPWDPILEEEDFL